MLSLVENSCRQNLPKTSAELLWSNLFCEFRAQHFTPKLGHFDFFDKSKITLKTPVDHRPN